MGASMQKNQNSLVGEGLAPPVKIKDLHKNMLTNIYSCKFANLIFMYSREEQAPPLPLYRYFADGQICKRTAISDFKRR